MTQKTTEPVYLNSSFLTQQDDIREQIYEGATFKWHLILMNTLAALIAMLRGPITSTAMALVDSQNKYFFIGLLTLSLCITAIVLTGILMGTLYQDLPLGKEIMARTAPNLMDLIIAMAGGVAVAYASINPNLNSSLVGLQWPQRWLSRFPAQAYYWQKGKQTWQVGPFS